MIRSRRLECLWSFLVVDECQRPPVPADMASTPVVHDRTADAILLYIHYASPIILLVSFLLVFTVNSIATAAGDYTTAAPAVQTGPGGKPLPQSKSQKAKAQRKILVLDFSPRRKLLFDWISLGVILTFVANAIIVISHALLDREHKWWCGPHVAVCLFVSAGHTCRTDNMQC